MNYMDKVAKMLGVEREELFKIDGYEGNFKLSENFGLVNEHLGSMPSLLVEILTGSHKIIKKPWKPKRGEKYYTVATDGNIALNHWYSIYSDIALYAMGNCYRTDAEAEAHKDEMHAKMKEVLEG